MSIKVDGLGAGELATLLEVENFLKEKLILLEEKKWRNKTRKS